MSAIAPKRKYITVNVSGSHYVHIDEEVDVAIDKLDAEELAVALEAKGWRCIPPPTQAIPADLDYRLWEALKFNRTDDLKRVASEIVYDRMGRIV